MKEDAYIIHNSYDGTRIRNLLELKHGFSKNLLNRLELHQSIYLNDQIIKLNKMAYNGDIIGIDFLDEEDEYEKVEMPIDILYEDLDLLVLNKRPFRVVHPSRRHQIDTTANAVAYYFMKHQINRKVRFVNRLDMNTTGVLIIAKNPHAHHMISQDMRNNKVDKQYVAVVEGIFEQKSGIINQRIARLDDCLKREVDESGKACITHYKVIKENNGLSMVEVKLETGRTHQIRVHFEHLGHPVLGDALYGKPTELISRQALHCISIEINHPRTRETLLLTTEVPRDMSILFE
ncbi:MAG: RluA family pseudouridine synthase [Tissierellales bacterium]|nr:RluA family pseudouridine synthase [Tissierellales bacterium]MBN2826751.1 RluA family pseudouridine synthase [Tissierellales bacterium]